jgi:hypothetical protein
MPTLLSTTLGKFCREIASGLSPLPVLLQEWDLTDAEYDRIKASDGYKAEMVAIMAEMQELGPDAGYIYRMKALSEEFISDIITIMRDPLTGAGTKVEIIKFVADLARLKEKTPTPAELKAQGPRGPTVVFNFGPGLPVKSMTLVPEPEGLAAPIDVQDIRRGFQLELSDD